MGWPPVAAYTAAVISGRAGAKNDEAMMWAGVVMKVFFQ